MLSSKLSSTKALEEEIAEMLDKTPEDIDELVREEVKGCWTAVVEIVGRPLPRHTWSLTHALTDRPAG